MSTAVSTSSTGGRRSGVHAARGHAPRVHRLSVGEDHVLIRQIHRVAHMVRHHAHHRSQRRQLPAREAGLSQVELAELSHIRQSRISEFETGRYSTANMSLKTAANLARALGAHAEDLLEDGE